MNELMCHIERAVRPLPAPQWRRREMREELLRHLRSLYDEERERLGDHESAVRAAIRQLGPADELSRRLRTTLPWHTVALFYVPLFAPVHNWPISVRKVAIAAWCTGVLFWLVVGVPWCCLLVSSGRYSGVEAALLWTVMAFGGAALLAPAIGIIGATHGVYRQPKSPRRVLMFGVAQYFTLGAVLTALETLRGGGITPLSGLNLFAPAFIPLLIALVARTKAIARLIRIDELRGRRTRGWEQLAGRRIVRGF